MAIKLEISNQRMLALMEWAVQGSLAANEKAFLQAIAFPPTNISNVRRGHQGFTKDHIANACKITGANANWIFGLESNMLRKPGKTAMQKLREVMVEVEQALKSK